MRKSHNQNDLLMSFGEDIFNFEEQDKQKVFDYNLFEDQNFLNEHDEKNSYEKNLSIFDEISPIESEKTGIKNFSKNSIKLTEKNLEFSSLVNIGNNNASFINYDNKRADNVPNSSSLRSNLDKKDKFNNSSNKQFKIKSSFLKPSAVEIKNNYDDDNYKSNINKKSNRIEKRPKEKAKTKLTNFERRNDNEHLSIQSKSNNEYSILKNSNKEFKKLRNKIPTIFKLNDRSNKTRIKETPNDDETEQIRNNKMEYLQNIRRIKEMNVAKLFQKNKQERKNFIPKNKKKKEKFKIISSQIELTKNLEESYKAYNNKHVNEKNCNNIQKSKLNDYTQMILKLIFFFLKNLT